MDCPNCGTWNPSDKDVCWRCQTPLPKPVEEKPRKPIVFLGLPLWAWVVIAIFFFSPVLFSQCAVPPV